MIHTHRSTVGSLRCTKLNPQFDLIPTFFPVSEDASSLTACGSVSSQQCQTRSHCTIAYSHETQKSGNSENPSQWISFTMLEAFLCSLEIQKKKWMEKEHEFLAPKASSAHVVDQKMEFMCRWRWASMREGRRRDIIKKNMLHFEDSLHTLNHHVFLFSPSLCIRRVRFFGVSTTYDNSVLSRQICLDNPHIESFLSFLFSLNTQ